MEYRNCEQYVLDKLETAEKRNDVLQERLDNLQARYDRLEARMNRIKGILQKYGKVRKLSLGSYIDVSIDEWKAEEKRDFDKIIRFAHLKDEDTNVPYDQKVKETELSDQEENATIIRDEIPDPDDEPETCVDLEVAEINDTPNECDATEGE